MTLELNGQVDPPSAHFNSEHRRVEVFRRRHIPVIQVKHLPPSDIESRITATKQLYSLAHTN